MGKFVAAFLLSFFIPTSALSPDIPCMGAARSSYQDCCLQFKLCGGEAEGLAAEYCCVARGKSRPVPSAINAQGDASKRQLPISQLLLLRSSIEEIQPREVDDPFSEQILKIPISRYKLTCAYLI